MRCEFKEHEISGEVQNENYKKYILCWISSSCTQKSYSMQMKRFVLETYLSEHLKVFYTAWYAFLRQREDELYLVVQVLEGHFSEKSEERHCNSNFFS